MLCGSALYADLIDDPAFVTHALDTVSAGQIALAHQLAPFLNDGPAGFAHQHGFMIRGSLLLRDDSAIMVSPCMYRQQIAPHDERVLAEMDGGGIHSCGNFMHNIDAMLELPSLQCLDFGQSPLNDVDAIYVRARSRRIALVRVQVTAEELRCGDMRRSLRDRFPTGVTLLHAALSLEACPRQCSSVCSECGYSILTVERNACSRMRHRRSPRRHPGACQPHLHTEWPATRTMPSQKGAPRTRGKSGCGSYWRLSGGG